MINKKYQKNKALCKVTFSLPMDVTQNAQEVRVVGDFNDWSWERGLKMKASKNEYRATVELDAGKRYEFRYQMDNGKWKNDAGADDYVPSPFDGIHNCVVSLEDNASESASTKSKAS